MMDRRRLAIAAGSCGVLAALAWTAASSLRAAEGSISSPVSEEVLAAERQQRQTEMAFIQERIRRDPFSAADRSWLASILLQRARETGNHEDVRQAEVLARRSLELRGAHNGRTWAILSMSLLEQHRFSEASEAARRLVETEPENVDYRAHLGEIQLELGEYDRAAETFLSLEPSRSHLGVAPRLARWLEISGRTEEARALLHNARDIAARRTNLPREQVAWFHLRFGDLELRHGRLDEAEGAFLEGLRVAPGDFRLLSAMMRLEAARGEWDEAIGYGERVLGQLLDPATLAVLSEIYAAKGSTEEAAEYAAVMQVAIDGQKNAFHRDWGLFVLDRGEQVDEVLAQARRDLDTRRDVYGYDLLAWALHKKGNHREARAAMAQAMRMGTEDAILHYHAGMIERALGHTAEAESRLERALEIHPDFHPTQAEVARSALRSLRRPWYRRSGS